MFLLLPYSLKLTKSKAYDSNTNSSTTTQNNQFIITNTNTMKLINFTTILGLLMATTPIAAKRIKGKSCAGQQPSCKIEGDNYCSSAQGVSVVVGCKKQGDLLCWEYARYCGGRGGCN